MARLTFKSITVIPSGQVCRRDPKNYGVHNTTVFGLSEAGIVWVSELDGDKGCFTDWHPLNSHEVP
jgi:hypothetical protein